MEEEDDDLMQERSNEESLRSMIVIIDYGMGNLRSVWKALEQVGAQVKVSDDPREIQRAQGVVLPGVGAFAPAMRHLEERGLLETVRAILTTRSKPFLGICLGLQLLMEESEEDGPVEGMRIIPGYCRRFVTQLKVPHMGWNQVAWKSSSALFEGIPNNSYFYFVHSYYVQPRDVSWTSGITHYEHEFTSAISKDDRIFAVQFHPEKSQLRGLKILENFKILVEKSAV